MIPGVRVIEPSFIHPDATIETSIIGPFASIGPNAVIKQSIVRDSIIDQGAQVDGAMLENSIVGKNAQVRGRASSVNVSDSSTVCL